MNRTCNTQWLSRNIEISRQNYVMLKIFSNAVQLEFNILGTNATVIRC